MNVVIALLNVALIFFLAYWLGSKNDTLRKVFWPALVFKLLSGLALGLIYTYYYEGGDTFLFFNDAMLLTKLARQDVMEYWNFLWQGDASFSVSEMRYSNEPRSLLFVKIVSIFSLITADNYWVTSLYFSFLTFASSWQLVITINRYFPACRTASIVSFLFVPSVVFWSAGVLKESLSMASIFFIAHVFIVLWMKGKVTVANWIGLLISIILLWNLKYYYAAILMPALLTSLIIRLLISTEKAWKRPLVAFVWWLCVFSVLLVGGTLFHPNFEPEVFFNLVLQNNLVSAAGSTSDSAIHFYNLQATPVSFIINAPWALLSGLFRPFVWEASNILQGIASIENLIILMLTITALKNVRNSITSENWLLIYLVLFCSFSLCVFLALSTPNFGTLSRYRTGFFPFFVFLVTCKNHVVKLTVDWLKRKSDALFGS